MREIKFRGTSMGGNYVYGYLTKKIIRNSGRLSWAIATGDCKAGQTIPVVEASVAQLLAVDANGKEVYEGDKVTVRYIIDDETGEFIDVKRPNWHCATFRDYADIVDGIVIKEE